MFNVVDANWNVLLISEHATNIIYNIYYQSNLCSENSHIVCKLHPFDDEGFQKREADNALFSEGKEDAIVRSPAKCFALFELRRL